MHIHSADGSGFCMRASPPMSVKLVSENRRGKVLCCRLSSAPPFSGRAYCLKILQGQASYLRHQLGLLERLAAYGRSQLARGGECFAGMPQVLECGMLPSVTCPDGNRTLYVASRWVEGIPLSRVIADVARGSRRLLLSEALSLLCAIAVCIREMGSCGGQGCFVHQDVKPSNIIVSLSPRVQAALIDFDTAFFLGDPAQDVPCGSFGYTAPEGILRSAGWANGAMDVLSFGVVAHELLTGRWPYPFPPRVDNGLAFWRRFYTRETELVLDRGILADVRSLLASCVAFDPCGRPSPAEVVDRLGQLASRYASVDKPCALSRPAEPPSTLSPRVFSTGNLPASGQGNDVAQ